MRADDGALTQPAAHISKPSPSDLLHRRAKPPWWQAFAASSRVENWYECPAFTMAEGGL